MAAKKIVITTAIPDSVLKSEIPSPSKVLYSVLIGLAITSENKIEKTNAELEKESGIAKRTICNALNQLEEIKLIKRTEKAGKRIISCDKNHLAAVTAILNK